MYYVARSLMKLQSIFGVIPRITGKGVGARVREGRQDVHAVLGAACNGACVRMHVCVHRWWPT